jgi:hypothetical protein
MLEVQRDRTWHDIISFDESWFYLRKDYEFMWLRRVDKVPEKERDTIQSKKFMLTIVWNPRGFHLIKVLEKGRKFNASYYRVSHIRWNTARHETGCAACPGDEQGKAAPGRLAAVKTR